ncbi:MAG TPA: cyclic nucleotide-binding domain-containing protein [Candidatus Limnocylindrales bacterium]|nr:cyclic nucleotide-binding domain-containing protein [Candidatus Limnocylindrales bacterium]
MDDKARLLARVPLFSQLDAAALKHVETLVDQVDVDAGTVLMTEGRTGREFFIILSGTVAVSRNGHPLATLGPGDYLGEIALVDDGPRTATATAETAARLLVLAHREFHSLLDEHPGVRMAVLQSLAQRVRNLDAQAT